jgi:hypothetical protein
MFDQIKTWHALLAVGFLLSLIASSRKAYKKHKVREQRLEELRKGITIKVRRQNEEDA